MILQALTSYYNRLLKDPAEDIPEPGFSREKIHFELVLGRDGTLEAVNNIQERAPRGNRLLPKILTVPEPDKTRRGNKIAANFIWDNTGYALGADGKDTPERLKAKFRAFRIHAHSVGYNVEDVGLCAVLSFLDAWHPEKAPKLDYWGELAGNNVVFRLEGESEYVHDRLPVRHAWMRFVKENTETKQGICLITGERASLARLHPPIKQIKGQQNIGPLVGLNDTAYWSYEKEQAYNAPVSEFAAFAYSTALNRILAGNQQKVNVADTTTVFWTEQPTQAESLFAKFLDTKDETPEAHDAALLQRLNALVSAVREGKAPPLWDDRPDTPFYVLGLSPNAARIAVRFWHVSDVGQMAQRLGRHFADLQIEKPYPNSPTYPTLWQLLLETAPQRKSENIPPALGGDLLRVVITGASYPRSLIARVIARIRADKEVTYLRAAMLKASYIRALRQGRFLNNVSESEVTVSLNPESTNVGYRLGRLFAALEKAQLDALPEINATIKDRFFGAASATPRSVFPRLIRLAQHHIAKAEYGYASDNRIAEIMEGLPAESLPAHLDMDGQAMFALGYYHQRNALYRKKETSAESAV